MARCPGLTSLFLSDSRFLTDECLATVAEYCPQLTSLSLHSQIDFGGAGLKALWQSGEESLTELRVGGCNQFTAAAAFAALTSTRLIALSVEGCHKLQRGDFLLMAAACPMLHELDMGDCQGLNEEGYDEEVMESVRAVRPGCRVIGRKHDFLDDY